jgi:hypothetical protein
VGDVSPRLAVGEVCRPGKHFDARIVYLQPGKTEMFSVPFK